MERDADVQTENEPEQDVVNPDRWNRSPEDESDRHEWYLQLALGDQNPAVNRLVTGVAFIEHDVIPDGVVWAGVIGLRMDSDATERDAVIACEVAQTYARDEGLVVDLFRVDDSMGIPLVDAQDNAACRDSIFVNPNSTTIPPRTTLSTRTLPAPTVPATTTTMSPNTLPPTTTLPATTTLPPTTTTTTPATTAAPVTAAPATTAAPVTTAPPPPPPPPPQTAPPTTEVALELTPWVGMYQWTETVDFDGGGTLTTVHTLDINRVITSTQGTGHFTQVGIQTGNTMSVTVAVSGDTVTVRFNSLIGGLSSYAVGTELFSLTGRPEQPSTRLADLITVGTESAQVGGFFTRI